MGDNIWRKKDFYSNWIFIISQSTLQANNEKASTRTVYIPWLPMLQELSTLPVLSSNQAPTRSLRASEAASHLQSCIRLVAPMQFLQQNLGTLVERMVIPQGLKPLKNGNQPWGLQPGPHHKGSGFQFSQATTLSTASRRKTIIQEPETTKEKRPSSSSVNHCRHLSQWNPGMRFFLWKYPGYETNRLVAPPSKGECYKELCGKGKQPEKA